MRTTTGYGALREPTIRAICRYGWQAAGLWPIPTRRTGDVLSTLSPQASNPPAHLDHQVPQ